MPRWQVNARICGREGLGKRTIATDELDESAEYQWRSDGIQDTAVDNRWQHGLIVGREDARWQRKNDAGISLEAELGYGLVLKKAAFEFAT